MKHDELTVPERQLQPPSPPKPISLNAFLKYTVKCDTHSNPMAGGRADFRLVSVGKVSGQAHLTFIGCKCQYWRPIK